MNKQTLLTKGNPSEEFYFPWLLLSKVNSISQAQWFMPMIPAVGRQENHNPRLGTEPHKPINPTEKLGNQSMSVSLSVLILEVEFRVWYVTGKLLKGETLTVGSTEYSS